jgi:hypothetical protein
MIACCGSYFIQNQPLEISINYDNALADNQCYFMRPYKVQALESQFDSNLLQFHMDARYHNLSKINQHTQWNKT